MNRNKRLNLFFLVVLFLTSSCLTFAETKQQDYGRLTNAVMDAPSKINGVYYGKLPSDFSSSSFLNIIKEKQKPPEDDFEVLSQYNLEVFPKGSYYLLIVRDPHTEKVILFDYSCTFEVDGQVFHAPEKYDLNHIEWYDPCKSPQK